MKCVQLWTLSLPARVFNCVWSHLQLWFFPLLQWSWEPCVDMDLPSLSLECWARNKLLLWCSHWDFQAVHLLQHQAAVCKTLHPFSLSLAEKSRKCHCVGLNNGEAFGSHHKKVQGLVGQFRGMFHVPVSFHLPTLPSPVVALVLMVSYGSCSCKCQVHDPSRKMRRGLDFYFGEGSLP